jgi:hypothetical protein
LTRSDWTWRERRCSIARASIGSPPFCRQGIPRSFHISIAV